MTPSAARQQPETLLPDVEIIAPSRALQMKIGGSAARLITPAAVRKAQNGVEEIKPAIRIEVERRISEIQHLIVAPGGRWRNPVWTHAHDIRGLAGTCDAVNLGRAANLLCVYLNDTGDDFVGDPNLVTSIIVVALQALKLGSAGHELLPILLSEARQAVEVQCKREGRSLAA